MRVSWGVVWCLSATDCAEGSGAVSRTNGVPQGLGWPRWRKYALISHACVCAWAMAGCGGWRGAGWCGVLGAAVAVRHSYIHAAAGAHTLALRPVDDVHAVCMARVRSGYARAAVKWSWLVAGDVCRQGATPNGAKHIPKVMRCRVGAIARSRVTSVQGLRCP